MKFFWCAFLIVLPLTNSLAQKGKDTLAYYHFTQLFDTTLTDSAFQLHYDAFYKDAYSKIDSNKQWHRGQTDYAETFYKSGFHQFNSTTYFNSMRNTLYVQQLCYNYKVIFKTQSGGDPMREYFEQDPIYELPIIDSITLPKNDTIYSPVTLYNHEFGKVVHFNTVSVYIRQEVDIDPVLDNLFLATRYIGIRHRRVEVMKEEDMPRIFIENH